MRFISLLALRYTFGLRKKGAVTLIGRFAAFVVGVAVFAFFLVLSVFGGLREFGLEFTHAFDPDLYIESSQHALFDRQDPILNTIYDHPDVVHASATLSQEMMLRFENKTTFATVVGVDSLFREVVDGETLVGEWMRPNENDLVLGIGVLSALDGAAYDHPEGVTLLVPNKEGKGVLQRHPFRAQHALVRGVFQLGEKVDKTTVFAPISMVQKFLRLPNRQANALYVKLRSHVRDVDVEQDLQKALGSEYRVVTKAGLNPALYKMLKTERIAIIAILTLVVIIALFNVVGAIIMTLLEKKENIQTLFLLGAPLSSLKYVFFGQGLLLSAVGGGIGLVLGILFVFLQKTYGLVNIPGARLPYPVSFEWSSFWTLIGVVGGLSLLVSWLTSTVVKAVVKR